MSLPVLKISEDIFLPCFRPLLNSTANINFLWGGRDSGKSYFIAEKLILDCLKPDYFRCVLLKKTFESIKDSQWQLIKDICTEWQIEHLFTFKQQPLEIHCFNGNKFIARGCDDPAKLKSISNPSHAWYEEGNQLAESDYIVATTTLRSNKGEVQEWFSFNPECEGDYKDFWLYRHYFANHIAKNEYTFTDSIAFTMPDGSTYNRTITSTHTTYHDNLDYCLPSRISKHESFKATNPYYYQVYTLGLWGKRLSGGEVMKCFKYDKHVGKHPYNPNLPLHISFDENVNPYFPCGIFQIDGKNIYLIDEIAGYHPNNKTTWMANEIKRKYHLHTERMYIYGDPASRKEDVKLKDGENLFIIMQNELELFKPELRVLNSHPSVRQSIDFFNTLLELNFNGLSFHVNETCKITIRDYENATEDANGNIDKKPIKDKDTGKSYQPYGHYIDLTRYFLCYAFESDYYFYKHGNKIPDYIIGSDAEDGQSYNRY
jgi:phage terminase large subunit